MAFPLCRTDPQDSENSFSIETISVCQPDLSLLFLPLRKHAPREMEFIAAGLKIKSLDVLQEGSPSVVSLAGSKKDQASRASLSVPPLSLLSLSLSPPLFLFLPPSLSRLCPEMITEEG